MVHEFQASGGLTVATSSDEGTIEGHLNAYFKHVVRSGGQSSQTHIATMSSVCDEFLGRKVNNFSFQHSSKTLLLGEVQSGKTAQLLALIAATADHGELFRVFVLLTTSNIALHQQTLFRCLESLPTFEVCGERDELRFRANANKRPTLIVLKKNSSVLKRWRNIFLNSRLLIGRPLVLIDDEADATSLNTAVNKGEQSRVNGFINEIVATASSSLFVQVTATPQALFLQSSDSGWKPDDTIYFPPGKGYVGGRFFFSDPQPYSYRRTERGELAALCRPISDFADLPIGFRRAVANYLLSSAQVLETRGGRTSFLVHPSWTTGVHSTIESRLQLALTSIVDRRSNTDIVKLLQEEWNDLQRTFPEMLALADLEKKIAAIEHRVHVLNSDPRNSVLVDFADGSNIVIGGNSLGRGLTFPMLLTSYYCRESRIPQMDTIWQHCRMFGYDRVAGLSRMFMSGDLFDLFSETHAANEALLELIRSGGASSVKILSRGAVRPTRRAVVDQSLFAQYVGGVNYFPNNPDQQLWSGLKLDKAFEELARNDGEIQCPLDELMSILELFRSSNTDEWSTQGFIDALKMYQGHRDANTTGLIVVRRDRDIAFGTGTLLSPNDRTLAMSVTDRPVLIAYRLIGGHDKGWRGSPFWIPNIKLPNGFVFNFLDE